MISETHKTANKGEWSEIYAFFKILIERSLNGADENLNPIPNKNFKVLKIVRNEKEGRKLVSKTYNLPQEADEVVVLSQEGGRLATVPLEDLRSGVREVFKKIHDGKGRSFSVPEAEALMDKLLCKSIKATSTEKSDIRLVLEDRFSPREIESGFSIKTAYKSAPATLLNASKGNTSFIYKIIKDERSEEDAANEAAGSVRDTVTAIYDSGSLRFLKMESDTFKSNLELIDSELPNILAAILAHYHRGDASSIADLTRLLPSDPSLPAGRDENFYAHKVKNLLESVALGMTPAKKWAGSSDTNGGFIVVKDSGELACYHVYDRSKFLDYLYEHTKLDTPSTRRHEYGAVYTGESGESLLKLNLQIRFI